MILMTSKGVHDAPDRQSRQGPRGYYRGNEDGLNSLDE